MRTKARQPSSLRQLLRALGPAFIVSVAYIDPGNFATNISGGSRYQYTLLWVILWSNIMAVFLQTMSAKLGIATGQNLPELCARVFSRRANWCFWVMAELGAMATDLAEFLGGTLGLNLLFGIPMWLACLMTGALTFLICHAEKYGQKIVEIIIGILVAIVSVSYFIEIFLAKPDWSLVAFHTVVPQFAGRGSIIISVGILGATVMPHVIYLHSQLVQSRSATLDEAGKRQYLKMEKIDIGVAMNMAFFVNAAMLIVAAAAFFRRGIAVDTMEAAHETLNPLLGKLSGAAFGVALLAAGLSSSAVGTMAGQTIMQGFVGLSIPVQVRRLITMLPALAIILLGVNPMDALVWSQVLLSFILPVPVIQMLTIARRRDVMGPFANTKKVQATGVVIAALVVLLNAVLVGTAVVGW